MVIREDREFLARAARVNRALAAGALPLINNTLSDTDSQQLGAELVTIGQEFLRRTRSRLDTGTSGVIDGEIIPDR